MEMSQMRNYFDQNFKTKFSKQTMSKQIGFQWVIEEMEKEFQYPEKDIETFNEFFLHQHTIAYI